MADQSEISVDTQHKRQLLCGGSAVQEVSVLLDTLDILLQEVLVGFLSPPMIDKCILCVYHILMQIEDNPMTKTQIRHKLIEQFLDKGYSYQYTADIFGITKAAVHKVAKKAGISRRTGG